ncbi:MAG: hypothetical protein VKM92_00505 [Cyanobacteriota bacterium]|nr:hypothetical protein [Cyanobacteriota bacterium]
MAATEPELEKLMAEATEQARLRRQQAWADAHAAAASGEGPQPWDCDWIKYQVDVTDEIHELAHAIGWHRTQQLIEVLDWALASPQGQRALAMANDPASPWQGALEMLKEFRHPLAEASLQMLRDQIQELACSDRLKDALGFNLERLVDRLYTPKGIGA